jgi:hypothetical protein
MLLAKIKQNTQHALHWILPSSSMLGNFNPLSHYRCSIYICIGWAVVFSLHTTEFFWKPFHKTDFICIYSTVKRFFLYGPNGLSFSQYKAQISPAQPS